MAEFPVNPTRVDPYKNFKFRLKWDGQYVAGVSKVSGLKRTTQVVEHREGGDPSTSHKSPGQTRYEAITLERGLTQDHDFEQWANKVWQLGGLRAGAHPPRSSLLRSRLARGCGFGRGARLYPRLYASTFRSAQWNRFL